MFRFVHAADIHLDSPLRGLESYPDAPVEQIRGAARRAFDNLVALAIEEEAAFVLLAGDLFDGDWKDYNTGLYFTHRMGRLREAGIRVFLVSGNHDAASPLTRALSLPDNVNLFSHKKPETRIIDELGVAIHGQSFAGRSVTEDLSRAYPQALPGLCNIGLLHTSLTGRAGHEPYAPCTLEGLASKGYDYWALGHVHQREVVRTHPWVVFPGNIQGRHIREAGAKGCQLVTVEEGRITEVDFRELDVLRFALCRVDLDGCESLEGITDRVRESMERERQGTDGRPLAARIILEGKSSLHERIRRNEEKLREECRAVAADLGDVWLEKFRIASKPSSEGPDEGDTPLAGLMRAVAELRLDFASLTELVPEFEALRSRLPADLLGEGDPFNPDEEGLFAVRDEVRDLLMARLAEGGHDH
ncbi:DNA repair exonuclease [Desulfomicrobium sp. ZS1]|uniref:metallophosphoesterase family protein n=1 Tax=Desulfomicrobium sp. ZS1 TaxID=2952228 RepID=UPI0020B34009|nr:DNA repair exonuclease [Desulfomicrobium sp. ZS1]UTF51883.1 DNA repair exonuclease [Desulfomicrobium sp. ZS1]